MVSRSLPPHHSGAGLQAVNLARHLRDQGVDVWLMTARFNGEQSVSQIDGIRTVQVSVRAPRSTAGRRSVVEFVARSFATLLRERDRWDLIHVHGAYSHYAGALAAAQVLRRPALVKVSLLGDDDPAALRKRRLGGVWTFLLRKASGYIALNQPLAAALRQGGVDSARIFLVPNGVDTDQFSPASAVQRRAIRFELGLPPDATVLCFVGVLAKRKGVHLAISAMRTLCAGGRDCHLVIVGERSAEPAYVDRLQSEVAQSALHAQITFAGASDRVEQFLKAADIFVHPSIREGMPNAVLEAMSVGLPCVVGRIPGIDEVIEANRDGFIVGIEDEQIGDMTAALVRLIDDISLRSRIGVNARHRICRDFVLAALSARYEDIYRILLKRPLRTG